MNNKKEELNLNEMLGIKKETKKNDFDDLLGDVGGVNPKNKKKNNDFFSDLQFWYIFSAWFFYYPLNSLMSFDKNIL